VRERLRPGSTARPWWAEELSADEAAAFWPLGLQVAPDYRWFLNVAGRRPMPLVRLVPPLPGERASSRDRRGHVPALRLRVRRLLRDFAPLT
jgi:hypothetical protein